MGSQFWWFYDVIVVAALLVCGFIWGRKGAMKGTFAAVGAVLAVVLALGVSSTVANGLREISVKKGNVQKLEGKLDSEAFADRLTFQMQNMGYSVRVDTKKLSAILDKKDIQYDEELTKYLNNASGKKLEDDPEVLKAKVHECMALTIKETVGLCLSKYAAESAAEIVRKDPSLMQELIPLIRQEYPKQAAEFISEKMTADAYNTVFRLSSFVVLFIVFWLAIAAFVKTFTDGRGNSGSVNATDKVIGAIMGIICGAAVVVVIAAAVRLSAALGSNEMLFFNNEAVDKSFVFKYVYGLINKL